MCSGSAGPSWCGPWEGEEGLGSWDSGASAPRPAAGAVRPCPGLAWELGPVGQGPGEAPGRLEGRPWLSLFLTEADALERTLLFSGPGLGRKDGSTPFLMTGLKADGLRCGLCCFLLGSGSSNHRAPSNFLFPLLHWLRYFSTVSLAQGSGAGWDGGHL